MLGLVWAAALILGATTVLTGSSSEVGTIEKVSGISPSGIAASAAAALDSVTDTDTDTTAATTARTSARPALLDSRRRVLSRDARRVARVDARARSLESAAEKKAQRRTKALAVLAKRAERRAGAIAASEWKLPVNAGAYHLTSRFGECSSLWSRCHTGLDFAAPTGTPIHAITSGRISETAYSGAYGNRTIETLKNGTELWYCHQTSFTVSRGDRVSPGQVIGRVGSTGNVTGPHVHVEVRPSKDHPVDPYRVLARHGAKP